jgi:hypothetical protein
MLQGVLLRVVLAAAAAAVLLGLAGLLLLTLLGRGEAPSGRRSYRLGVVGSVLLLALGLAGLGLGTAVEAWSILRDLRDLRSEIAVTNKVLRASYRVQSEQAIRALLETPRYRDPGKLNRYEYRVFSQSGEDGLIAEIFRRIGTTNRFAVEFGAADGFENNTVLLLRQGWGAFWIEGDPALVRRAAAHFAPEIRSKKLTVTQAFVTADNIEDLFKQAGVPEEFDLLSIDIDRNDYYVWEKITHYSPRVVVIEYNPLYPPTMSWVIPYDPQATWDFTTRSGASLKALEQLGAKKGYSLVGCNLAGVNVFFVRNDLLGDHFAGPFTAENHYEPERYSLNQDYNVIPRVP